MDLESGEQKPEQPIGKEQTISSGSNPSELPSSLIYWKGATLVGLLVAIPALVVASMAFASIPGNDYGVTNQHTIYSNKGDQHDADYVDDTASDVERLEGSTTLFDIKERGSLNCGITISPGFGKVQDSENGPMYSGMDVDLCRAVSSAIFGHSDDLDTRINFAVLTATERFEALESQQVDILARITTLTMDRDVWVPSAQAGFSFSVPYVYDGHRFAGVSSFVECADDLNASGDCVGLKVCVNDGTTTSEQLNKLLPAQNIVVQPNNEATQEGVIDGTCNAIFAGSNAIAEASMRQAGFEGDYSVGDNIFSLEPLALVTRDDDARFTDFVNWVLQALLSAEEQGVSQSNFQTMPTTHLFGETFKNMLADAIAAVGNYGEIYERNLAELIPRGGLNRLNNGDSGRILSHPFGAVEAEGPEPFSGTLHEIKQRGHLNCGITRRAGFGEFDGTTFEWSGLDVDYCRALSAAIFDGVPDNVVYHVLPATARFEAAQAMGFVDVLSRITTHTFERDVLETTTQMGFTFSQANFYDGLSFGGIPPFAACADNLDTTGDCRGVRICVNAGTTTIARTRELFPEANIVPMSSGEASLDGLASGVCNVVAGGSHDIAQKSVESAGYFGDYEIGRNRFSKDPLALVTRQEDARWSEFVYWVVSATFYAEEQGISKTTANDELPAVNLFGPLYRNMLRNAVQAVGNYGDIYARNVESIVPRSGLNLLNTENGPQFYPLPGIVFLDN